MLFIKFRTIAVTYDECVHLAGILRLPRRKQIAGAGYQYEPTLNIKVVHDYLLVFASR